MAKSYVSAMVGAAIADGYIKSVDDPVTDYIIELKSREGFDKIKIKHLLQMTSGISGRESYWNPLGYAARLYYGHNSRRYLSHLRIRTKYAPGAHWTYSSINTELLGLIIERTSGKSLTEYLNDKIWSHIGTEYEASWSIDRKKNGFEKTFCCINAKARDFAKFGRLYLHNGNWFGKQLIPENWVNESTQVSEGGVGWYAYQWWLTKNGYTAEGILGQFIYVNPEKKLIIVRLGKSEGRRNWPSLFDQISEGL